MKSSLKNLLWVVAGIAFLAGILLAAVAFKKTDLHDRQAQERDYAARDLDQALAVIRYNIGTLSAPPRRQDQTKRMQQEDSLRQLASVFKEFSSRDWGKFWELLYKDKKRQSILEMKRWRTKGEIERFMVRKFEDPFAMFTPEHWAYFWGIIEEDKGFRHVVYDDAMTEEDQMLLQKDKAVFLKTPRSVRPQFGYK